MAYYIAVERIPNEFEAINIKTTIKGKKIFGVDNSYSCTLEEIDKYTTSYSSLRVLTHELCCEHKVPWPNSPLSIINVMGNTKFKIIKGFLFINSKKFLEKPELATKYIVDKYIEQDINFFKELSSVTLDEQKTKNTISKLILNIEQNIINNILPDTNEVINFAETLIYKLDETGKTLYPKEIDYETLHNIVVFIADYEHNLKMNKEQVNKRIKTKNA